MVVEVEEGKEGVLVGGVGEAEQVEEVDCWVVVVVEVVVCDCKPDGK